MKTWMMSPGSPVPSAPHGPSGSLATWILAAASAGLMGCGGAGEQPASRAGGDDAETGPLTILTVNYPLAYFAQRMGGAVVDARYPGPSEGDPAGWSLTPEDVIAFQDADMILLNGANYAAWTARVTLPEGRMVNTSEAFADRYIVEEASVTHAHGPEGEHSHGETAFTTWLDMEQAAAQADAVAEALTRARPTSADAVLLEAAALRSELEALDARLLAWGEALEGAPVLASHPVYQYLARRYALILRSVHWEPGEAPTERQWREFEALVREHPARIMLWEGEPLPDVEERLTGLGVRVVVFDPTSTPPEDGDFLTAMTGNVERAEGALPRPR